MSINNVQFADVVNGSLSGVHVVSLPAEVASGLGIPPSSAFHFLESSDPLPPNKSIVIASHPKLLRGNKAVTVVCGKLLCQKMSGEDGENPEISVMIRGDGNPPAKMQLSEDEFSQFRPLAVFVEE